jgi:hypothetical protein
MKRVVRIIARVLLGLVLLSVAATLAVTHPDAPGPVPTTFPHVAREPAMWRRATTRLTVLPKHTDFQKPFEVDLRGTDISALDLRDSAADLEWASFDSATIWPRAEKLPSGFDPTRIMEFGKSPGLGLRALHDRGITGRGIGIAVIDQPLLLTHREYAGRIRLYEDIGYSVATRHINDYANATMHGCATASIAVGKTVGVAPEADLYYIAVNALGFPYVTRGSITFTHYARAVRRIVEINRTLPAEHKIRAISLSIGWQRNPRPTGFDEITAAVAEAKAAGILVTSSSLEFTHGFRFHGIDRDPMIDPDDFAAHRPGKFWAETSSDNAFRADRLLVPMDHRTVAAPGGDDQYAHYASGGWSWCTPYLAGVYVLACQVDSTLTPDEFWAAALKTGRTIQFDHADKRVSLGPIIDPQALIETLRR